MKKHNGEYARVFVTKAEHDWRVVCVGLETELPNDTICFHIQQAAEKLLKALLAWKDLDYPFTHDLKGLLKLVVPVFPALAEFEDALPLYSEYATVLRYDELADPSDEETKAAFETVKRLRDIVHAMLPPEARPA